MNTLLKSDEQILEENGVLYNGTSNNHPYPIRLGGQQIFLEALRTERIVSYQPGKGDCKGRVSPLGARLTMQGGHLALVFATGGAAKAATVAIAGSRAAGQLAQVGIQSTTRGAGATVGAALTSPLSLALFGIGIGLTIWGIFKAHHAKAVAKERATLCAFVPAFNDALSKIDDAVISNRITPQQGMDLLNGLLENFKADVHSILKMNQSQCNAACYVTLEADVIIDKKLNQYQILKEKQQSKKSETNLLIGGGIGYAIAKVFGLV